MDYSHGIVHTPSTVKASTIEQLGRNSKANIGPGLLKESTIKYVRVYWADFANVRRCRIVPLDHFNALLKSNRPSVNITKVCFGFIDISVAPGFLPIGEYLYTFDLSTLRRCPFATGHLAVLGRFEEKSPIQDGLGNLTVQAKLCPRTLLGKIIEQSKKEFRTEYLIGFESEFILLKSTDPVVPSNVHQWSASNGLLAGSAEAIVLEEIADCITASGIKLEMLHSESAPGQYEIVTGPLAPLEAADALLFTREIIVQVAAKHGLHATFAPRPFPNSPGSSTHAHLSIHSSNKPKTANSLSKPESMFLAGLLDHLPAVPALTLPTSASYARMADGAWSGGTYICYGTENREAPIRLTNATSPASRNFELRFIDGTANPHLALAAILAAGSIGLKTKKELIMGDCPGPNTAAQMTGAERERLGIVKRMPSSIGEALQNLERDTTMLALLGSEFVEKYISFSKTLEEVLTQGQNAEEHRRRLVKFY